MDDYINVVYDKKTGRVLVIQTNNEWVIPAGHELVQFKNGVSPVLISDSNGNLYLKPNTMIITDY